jgi:GntR family transcriptional repressor for pyruvate dehydrogenase complex
MTSETENDPGALREELFGALTDRNGAESGADPALGMARTRNANSITNRLRRAIEAGAFNDGDQLPPERQLALALGTARSTVRKSLDQLESEGMVVRRVGSGTFVNYEGPARTSTEEISYLVSPMQLVETRFSVEPYMARLAAIHANQKDLENFEEVLCRIEDCGDDQDQFTRFDSEFHLQLARCSRNPLMLRIYQQINTVRAEAQWNQVKRVILTGEKIADYNREHRRIFEALRQRDVNGAVEAMTAHLESARQDLLGAQSS